MVDYKALVKISFHHAQQIGVGKGRDQLVSYLDFLMSAFNCIVAILTLTQVSDKFLKLVLTEKPNKGQFLWKNIIDTTELWEFSMETNFVSVAKDSTVTALTAVSAGSASSSQRMGLLSSQYLADSSLSPDVGPSVPAGESKHDPEDQDVAMAGDVKTDNEAAAAGGGEGAAAADGPMFELDPINQHPCMAGFLRVFDFLHRLHHETWGDANNIPIGVSHVYNKLKEPGVHSNIKWFLAKIIINRWELFQPYAALFLEPLVDLATAPAQLNGGKGHSFFLSLSLSLSLCTF